MKFLNAIKYFFVFLWQKLNGNISDVEIDDINTALEKAIKKRQIKRNLIKAKVYKYLRKTYGFKGSKYIPIKGYNYELMHADIIKKYGEEIEAAELNISKKLIWNL